METKQSTYYGMIDVLRLVFAVAVVSIHTMAFQSINEDLRIATSMGISRLAVPFYFVVTGYFLYNRISLKKEPKSTLKRLLILYASWVFIEVIALFPGVRDIVVNYGPIALVITLIVAGITGSLWYISSLIFTILVISPLLKRGKIILLLIIGFVLYVFGMSGDTYYGLFKNTILSPLIEGYLSIFRFPQVGFNESILFVSLGAAISKYKLNEKIKNAGLLSIISIILLLIEAFILNKTGIAKDANLYLTAIVGAPLIVIWAINYNKSISAKTAKACKEYGLGIYCSHQIFMIYLSIFAPTLFANSMIRFIFSLLISTLVVTLLRKTRVKGILLK